MSLSQSFMEQTAQDDEVSGERRAVSEAGMASSESVAVRLARAPIGRRIAWGIAFCLWSVGAAAGCWYGIHYQMTPGQTANGAQRWPDDSSCTHSQNRPTLVMFVHPRCPCSRASLNELAVLMTRCHNRIEAQVLFICPEGSPAEWARTDLWETATRLPGVIAREDQGGQEQRRFGARVSGETFVYSPGGELAFHGGITGGRGHAGDNLGRSTLESFLLHHQLPATTVPVFGCDLQTPPSGTAR